VRWWDRTPGTGEGRISLCGIDNHLDPASEGNGEVLEAARGGNRDALEALVTAHYDRVHALCRRMLGNDADALDATQDALLAAIRGLSRFDGRSAFATWLYRVATNVCLDELRRRRRRPVTGIAFDVAEVAENISSDAPGLFTAPVGRNSHPAEGAPDGEDRWHGGRPQPAGRRGPGLSSTTPGGGRDPADVVAARIDVDAALAVLPVEFRTAVVLRDVCDLPYEEIAEILDVPIGTVRSRIARARSALAATWKSEAASASDQSSGDTAGNRAVSPDVRTDESDRTPTTGRSGTDHRLESRSGPAPGQSPQEEHTQ